MTKEESLAELAAEWRMAADDVLDVARVAAPLAADDMAGLELAVASKWSATAVPPAEVVDHRVNALLSRSDDLLAEIGDDAGAIPVLLGALEVGNALLVSSQNQEEAFRTLGPAADGVVSMAGPALALDELRAAVVGEDAPATVPLPPELTGKLDSLQNAGAKELIALGEEAVLQQVLGKGVTAVVSLGGEKVERAFEWVKSKVHFIRRAAVRILEWVVDKFKRLVPVALRDKVDKAIDFVVEKLKGGVEPAVGALLGELLGREGAEQAWQVAVDSGKDMTTAKSKLETVISGHTKRIGYVSTARTAVAGAGAVVEALLSIAVPEVQIVLGALVVALAGFVCWQLWDGFNDIEGLVAPAE